MSTNRRVIPLGERRGDWFFVACFALFAFTSFFSDALAGLGVEFDPHSDSMWVRANYWYAANTDPYFLSYPAHLRVQTFVSGFVFGPFYLVLAYAFAAGKDWIRVPAVMYVGAMMYGMVIHLGSEFFGGLPPTNLPKFLAFNLPYLLVPLGLAYRMRRDHPFSEPRLVVATRREQRRGLAGTGT